MLLPWPSARGPAAGPETAETTAGVRRRPRPPRGCSSSRRGSPAAGGSAPRRRGALAETDVQLVLTLASSDRERRRLAQFLASHRVDGVLLVSVHAGDPLPELLAELGIPAVISGRRSAVETLPSVDSDDLAGAAEAVRHPSAGAGAR